MLHFRFIAVVVAIFTSSVAPVSAQPRLNFENVRTTGPVPFLTRSVSVPSDQIAGLRIDPIGQRIHWILGSDWYRLHIPTRMWTRHSIQNSFDVYVNRWDVVPGTTELRVWDGGVGRVYHVDSTGTATRIDRSFNHKHQYGHLHHVEANGTIHAIGGWGLFASKNFGVQFSDISGGWHRTSGIEAVVTDPYITGGFTMKDPLSDELILFSHYGELKSPHTMGLLTMNMTSGTIRLRHRDLPTVVHTDYKGLAIPNKASVHNGAHRLAFAFGSSGVTSALNSTLIALDLDTYHRVFVKGTIGTEMLPTHLLLHYVETDSTLYSIQWTYENIEYDSFLSLTSAKVDVNAVKAALRTGKPPVSSNESIAKKVDLPIIIATAVLIWIGGIIVWKRRSKRTSISIAPLPFPHQPERVPLTLTLSPLHLNGKLCSDLLGPDSILEAKLLELLAESMADGQPGVSSDIIDRLLIPSHPSPDYIRKTRNHTRKRLEDSLQNLFPTEGGQPYILTDRELLDKRKTNHQLNPNVVSVSRSESASQLSATA